MSKRIEILHRVAFALACALPFLIATGRAPADVGVALLALLFVLHSLLARDWAWLRNPQVRVLAVIWLYLVAASPWVSDAPQQSLLAALAWVRFPLCYAALVAWLLKNPRAYADMCLCALIAAGLAAVDTYWQYITGTSLTGHPMLGERLTGPLPNANIGNMLLKLTFPAAGALAFRAMATGRKVMLWNVILLCIIVAELIPLTGERSITLLLLAGLCVTGAVLWWKNPAMRKAVLLGVLAVALSAAALSTQSIVRKRSDDLHDHLSHFQATPYGQIYTGAFDLWKAHPLTGVGLHRFWDACQPLLAAHEVTLCDIHAHNIYLQWLAESGLIGFALFAAFVALCARDWWHGRVDAKGAAVVAYAASAGTLFVLLWPVIVTQNIFSNWPGALFWVTLALANAQFTMHSSQLKNAR